MWPFACAIGLHAHDVAAREVPLVDSRWRDPDVARAVADGEIAAGRCRHAIAIDALHRPHDFVTGMDQLSRCDHCDRPKLKVAGGLMSILP